MSSRKSLFFAPRPAFSPTARFEERRNKKREREREREKGRKKEKKQSRPSHVCEVELDKLEVEYV